MLNAMQFFPTWESYFNHPAGGRLGLLSAMYSIGSIASLPFVPILSDHFGRKLPIIIGCFIMIAAAAIQVRVAMRRRMGETRLTRSGSALPSTLPCSRAPVSSWVSATR